MAQTMITDLETFFLDVGFDRIFRMYEKRTPGDWTPYEQEMKYIDESRYVSNGATYIKIVEVIELPDKDVLLGYKTIYGFEDIDDDDAPIEYRKLSQIDLSYYPEDAKKESWEEYIE